MHYFLQAQVPPMPQTTYGLLFGAVCVLAGVVVTLALYIRKLHNKAEAKSDKNTEIVLNNQKETTAVIANINNSMDNNTDATKDLRVAITDLHKYIIETTRNEK